MIEQMCYDPCCRHLLCRYCVWSTPFSNGPCVLPVLCSGRVEVHVTTGTIKKVVADRGFGFIAADDAKEYFFHRGGLDSTLDFDRLVGGEKVKFEIEQSPKGPRAAHVSAA
jgi:CspA family cold shock protein